ncbi:MAG: hypothetical protein R3F53_15780 [Gammaproteobacteria bacterium]
MLNIITGYPMGNIFDSICPIFLERNEDIIEQVGSGVLITISDAVFLLTAAHVVDWSEKGVLCIPSNIGIVPIEGSVVSVEIPKGLTRSKDKIDLAYYKLSKSLSASLHQSLRPLEREHLWLTDNTLDNDIYTFSGFPVNKCRSKKETVSTELFSYSGHAAIDAKYENLGYDKETNIVINYRLKKSVSPDGVKLNPPHPRGISGGGIFRWPKDVGHRSQELRRSLVGIAHTYLKTQNCLIGTRLDLYYQLIAQNNSHLFPITPQQTDNQGQKIPKFISVVCYRKEEWPLLMSQFADADHMQNSWNEWRQAVENGFEQMYRKNVLLIPIELTADEIINYCASENLPNTGNTRADLASRKLAMMLREERVL